MASTRLAINVEGLSRTFGSVRALEQVSLAVPSGIVFGLLGPNGAGKTTMIRLLLGLLAPDAGRATVLGYDVTREGDAVRRRCGALLEHPGLYERLSAADNLEFYARAWALSAAARRARIHELLSGVGLWDRRGERVAGWSRGMKQQLAIARAMLHRPELLFLDEPTAGLDALATVALRETVAALVRREGVTVFLTTHMLTEAERICQQVGIIRQGKLIVSGTPDELRARRPGHGIRVAGRGFTPELLEMVRRIPSVTSATVKDGQLFVDLVDPAATPDLVARLTAGGALIEELQKDRASLEQVFIELMKDPQ
ncbi:MAG: ABC transporter ATP-binding protein [Gemmatimonadetes bacterium]|nr:MAG: ABC transporter ATP-binding protein [Gemmatimonadota bacterium]